MSSDIDFLLSGDEKSWRSNLERFVQNATNSFGFPELTEGSKRSKLWQTLCHITKNSEDPAVLKNCFIAFRILGREKYALNEIITDELLELIKKHSGLDDKHFVFNDKNTPVAVEALKSLCNISYNSPKAAKTCCENGIFPGIIKRMKKYNDLIIPPEIKFFDMKLLFLLTALCPESRSELKQNLNVLIEILECVLKQAATNHLQNQELPPIYLNDDQVDFVGELLKALFNVSIGIDESDPEVMANCLNLTEILRNYLLIPTSSLEKTWMLRNNVINLLTNMPNETYKVLITKVQDGHKVPKNLEYDGENMTSIYEILMFLKAKFNEDPQVTKQHEVLSPVVTVLLKATNVRPIRKFMRNQILPPLKDVHTRPEQGSTLRNHLCRMLTTPNTQLRDLVAELLFVLCKKNVARMIKYTGYGNAAGLFAQRGLLAGGKDQDSAEFSSDSDSETEEYAEHKHGINPVIGCYEEPHPNVMENMTEEQKEYEAMKLVELMDSLMKTGTIKPCTVGKDGKPHPIEHVLELREGLIRNQQVRLQESDSD